MYKVWRQAYKGFNNIKYSKVISSSNISYADALNNIKSNLNHRQVVNGKVYWLGLQLFDNQIDANKEIFDIDKYGK